MVETSRLMEFFLFPGSISLTVILLWYSLAVISNSVVYGSTFTLQSILIVMLLRRTLNCDFDSLDCGIHWNYFCLWNFLAVLWIVILPCNTFIIVLSDSTLDISVIFLGSPFVF